MEGQSAETVFEGVKVDNTQAVEVVVEEVAVIEEKEPVKQSAPPLIATISEISTTGLMTVTFDQKVSVPANFTSMNETDLEIEVIPGANSDVSVVGISDWQV